MPNRKPVAANDGKNDQTANLGFVANFWASADWLRSHMDAAESPGAGTKSRLHGPSIAS